MAPEQLAADPAADHRVDLYGVGLLAYELLTGAGPFSGASPQDTLAAQLRALDPQHTLARGYAIVRDAAGAIVTDAARLAARDRIEIAVARGRIGADVTDIGTPDGTDGNPALRRG